MQSAYEILSDPHERAWYDSHRDAILHGGDTKAEDHFEHNIRLTSADDIVTLISRFSRKTPFTDAPDGFYGVLRNTFANLAREEEAACEWEDLQVVEYPTFGKADDSYEAVVKPFYSIWLGFSTKKSYSWKATYKYSEAPDRRIRRAMEKENKRLCDEAIRDFNEAVRSLVAFARKRDLRYTSNAQSEADRQKTLREASAAQAARSRAANEAKLKTQYVPNWAKAEAVDDEDPFSEEEMSAEEHYECVTCGKTFKSERQYEAHERSKKHIKAVQQLRRQMQKENKNFNLDDGSVEISGDGSAVHVSGGDIVISDENKLSETLSSEQNTDNMENPLSSISQGAGGVSESETVSDSEDFSDEYASRDEVEARFSNLDISKEWEAGDISVGKTNDDGQATHLSASCESSQTGDANPKIGKAKLKRAKRAARQEVGSQVQDGVRTA